MIQFMLTQEMLDDIHADGEERYPEETAGLLLGRVAGGSRQVTQLLPIQNEFAAGERHHRYQISPEAMIEAEDMADELGVSVIGVFHSHPDHPAEPSEFDRQLALPWFTYLITRVESGRAIESRVWLLRDDRQGFDEVPIRIQPVER
jgi:proteasome lid subunit RPN8/RPN11